MRYLEVTKEGKLVEQDPDMEDGSGNRGAHRFFHNRYERFASLEHYFDSLEMAYDTVGWISDATGKKIYNRRENGISLDLT